MANRATKNVAKSCTKYVPTADGGIGGKLRQEKKSFRQFLSRGKEMELGNLDSNVSQSSGLGIIRR